MNFRNILHKISLTCTTLLLAGAFVAVQFAGSWHSHNIDANIDATPCNEIIQFNDSPDAFHSICLFCNIHFNKNFTVYSSNDAVYIPITALRLLLPASTTYILPIFSTGSRAPPLKNFS